MAQGDRNKGDKAAPAAPALSQEEVDSRITALGAQPVVMARDTYDKVLNSLQAGLDRPMYDPGYGSLQEGFAQTLSRYALQGTDYSYKTLRESGASDSDIIQLFGRDEEGRPFEPGSFIEGFKRKIASGVASVPAFIQGARATNAALQVFPPTAVPVTPAQALIRVGGPIVGGLTTSYYAQKGADYLTRQLLGEAPMLIPDTEQMYRFGEFTAEAVPGAFLPFAIKSAPDLGVQTLLRNTTPRTFRGRPLSGDVPTEERVMQRAQELFDEAVQAGRRPRGPESFVDQAREELTRGGMEAFKGQIYYTAPGQRPVRRTRSLAVSEAMEGVLRRMRESAVNSPKRYFGVEIPAAVAGAGAASALEGPFEQILTEVSVSGATGIGLDVLLNRLGLLVSLGSRAWKTLREKGVKGAAREYFTKQDNELANFLINYVERYGREGEVEAIIEALESDRLEALFTRYREEKLAAGEDAPELELTAGVKARSPILLALEKAVDISDEDIGRQRGKANRNAVDALVYGVQALYGTGDQGLVSEAAEIAQQAFELNLQQRLDARVTNLTRALEKLSGRELASGEVPDMAEYGGKLREVVENNLRTDRAKETFLYNNVPNVEITEFRDKSGEVLDVPNVVSVLDRMIDPDAPEQSTRRAREALRDLIDFSEEIAQRFNAPTPDLAMTPEAQRLQDLIDETRGTDSYEAFSQYTTQFNLTEATPEVLRRLSEAEKSAQGPRGRATPLSRLYDAQRKALIAQQRQAADRANQASEKDPSLSVKELMAMRSTAETIRREARSGPSPNPDVARRAGYFIDAIDNDILNTPNGANLEYDLARAYSRALNNVYFRSFLGDVLQEAQGGYKFLPEEIVRRMFTGNKATARADAVNSLGVFQAAQALTTLFQGAGERGQALLESFNEAVPLMSGRKSPDLTEMRKWVEENRAELEDIPGIGVFVDENGDMLAQADSTLYDNMQTALKNSVSLSGIADNVLRQIRLESMGAIRPETMTDEQALGKLNANAIRQWLKKPENAQLADLYPGLRADLEDIANGDTGKLALLNTQLTENKARIKDKEKQFSFYTLLPDKTENPSTQIGNAIRPSQPRPITNLNGLWKVVEDLPDDYTWTSRLDGSIHSKAEAREGFRSAFLDAIIQDSTRREGGLDAAKFYRNLFVPLEKSAGKVSLAEWAVSKDVFSEAEINDIREMARLMFEFEATVLSGKEADISALLAKVGPGIDLLASVAGSAAGTRLQQMLPGDTGTGALIAAGRGAQFAKEVAATIRARAPNIMKMDALKAALKDPSIMADLLRRGKTEKEKSAAAANIAKFLADNFLVPPARRVFTSGVLTPSQILEEEPAPEEEAPAEYQYQQAPRQRPAAPGPDQRSMAVPAPAPTRVAAAPAPALGPRIPAGPQRPTPQTSGPVDRGRFLSLFPSGPAADLARTQQGIGSLM